MKKLTLSSLIFLLIIFTSFFSISCTRRSKEPIYCKYMDEVTAPYIRYIKSNYDLQCYGGGGSFIGNIQQVALHFTSHRELNTDSVRVLLINCIEELLLRINQNEQVRPYLSNYPFTSDNIRLTISFDKAPSKHVSKEYIALAYLVGDNGLFYDYYDSEDQKLKTIHKESYAEALQIVKVEGKLKLSTSSHGLNK